MTNSSAFQSIYRNPKRSKSYESLMADLHKPKEKCLGNNYDSESATTPASKSLSDIYYTESSDTLWEVPTVMKIKTYLESTQDGAYEENEDMAGGDTARAMKDEYSLKKLMYKKLIDFCHCWLREKGLFPKTYCQDSTESLVLEKPPGLDEEIFVKGFKLGNMELLQRFLIEEKKLLDRIALQPTFSTSVSSTTVEVEVEGMPTPVLSIPEPEPAHMSYLMPEEYFMPTYEFPFTIPEQEKPPQPSEEFWHPNSAVRKAQLYLRQHKVFQFFNYLTAMLVSASPEDPIDYLLALLDRVLLYRTGLLSPPLLYEKKHIEQLFHLMDRFGQGYVDIQQYKTAMETFGICAYNKRPILNNLSMVSREVFVEEIFSAELAMFNDLIQSRVSCTCDLTAPPPTIIDLDLKTQTTSTESVDDSVQSTQFNPVASVEKFWEKHGDKQPKAFKGRFWTEFVREAQRRDSVRRSSDQTDNEQKPLLQQF